MAVEYKLTYFDTQGLAEPIRYIFAIAGVPYEDIRFPKDENWPRLLPEVKEKLPWGTVPVLEHDGQKLSQSKAITRFLARKFNMAGANALESAKCDEYVDALSDFMAEWVKLFHETDEAKKSATMKNNIEVVNPKYFTAFNNILASCNGKWLVGSDLTWADICLAHSVFKLGNQVDFLHVQAYPHLKSHGEAFHALPQVKEWMQKRPETI